MSNSNDKMRLENRRKTRSFNSLIFLKTFHIIKFQIEQLRINENCVAQWVEILSEGTLEYLPRTHTTVDEKGLCSYGCLLSKYPTLIRNYFG